MPPFSRNQARLAKALVSGAKTAKELREETSLPLNEVEADLARLITLRVVDKLGGYPTKYQAVEAVRKGVMDSKTEGQFKAHVIIEGQSKELKALQDASRHLRGMMEKDRIVHVASIKEEAAVKEDETYTNIIEADVTAKSFEDLVYFVLNYGPSSIELHPIGDYVLKASEAQEVLMDIASLIQAYATTLVQKDFLIQEYRKKSPEVFIR